MNLRYQICACLYQGTACEVFLVRDIVTSQLYALKRIVRHHAKIFRCLSAGGISKRGMYAGMAAA